MEYCTNSRHLLAGNIRGHTFSSFYRMHNHEYWELTFNSEPLELIHNGKQTIFEPYTATIYRPNKDSHELHRGFHISIKLNDILFKELCELLHSQLYTSLLNETISLNIKIEKLAAEEIFRFFNTAFIKSDLPFSAMRNRISFPRALFFANRIKLKKMPPLSRRHPQKISSQKLRHLFPVTLTP